MRVGTTRFGELEVKEEDVIHFDEGPLGFENLGKFIVVDPGDHGLILWFQSVEVPETAFPIIESGVFRSNYTVNLLPAELNSLGLESVSQASVYSILTIPREISEMSANLKAPIVINNKTRKARQIVLQDSKLEVCYKMYGELKAQISRHSPGPRPERGPSAPRAFFPERSPSP